VENSDTLPLVDRIAICAAGLEAQKIFSAPTHKYAAADD
jgi:hypothetical protein